MWNAANGKIHVLILALADGGAGALQRALAPGLIQSGVADNVSLETIVVASHRQIFEELDRPERKDTLAATVAVVQACHPNRDPWWLLASNAQDGIYSELILSYPEVLFLFAESNKELEDARSKSHVDQSTLVGADQHFFRADFTGIPVGVDRIVARAHGRLPIFDPSGLRNSLKAAFSGRRAGAQTTLPTPAHTEYENRCRARTTNLAVAIDDEADFAWLYGLAAYKCGLRAETITTYSAAQTLDTSMRAKTIVPQVLMSDLDLVFADLTDDQASDALADGYRRSAIEANPAVVTNCITSYPAHVRRTGAWTYCDPKPFGGLFAITGLRAFEKRKRPPSTNFLQRIIAHFKKTPPTTEERATPTKHTAPYRTTVVTNRLLERAAKRFGEPDTTRGLADFVLAAVLSADAKELLGGLAKTSSYRAIALQNQAEVRAELEFFGVRVDMDESDRIEAIEQEVLSLQGAANSDLEDPESEASGQSFLVQIYDKLRVLWSERDLVKAADACLVAMASAERQLLELRIFRIPKSRRQGQAKKPSAPKPDPKLSERKTSTIVDALRLAMWTYFDKTTRAGTSFSTWFAWLAALCTIVWLVSVVLIVIAQTHLNGFQLLEAAGDGLREVAYVALGDDQHAVLSHMGERLLNGDAPRGFTVAWRTFALPGEVLGRFVVGILHFGMLLALIYRKVTRRSS